MNNLFFLEAYAKQRQAEFLREAEQARLVHEAHAGLPAGHAHRDHRPVRAFRFVRRMVSLASSLASHILG